MPRRYSRTARGAPADLTGKRLSLALEEELQRPSECDFKDVPPVTGREGGSVLTGLAIV